MGENVDRERKGFPFPSNYDSDLQILYRTGPGVFTDAVLDYLERFNLREGDIEAGGGGGGVGEGRRMEGSFRVGDVAVLNWLAFRYELVIHKFFGGWKTAAGGGVGGGWWKGGGWWQGHVAAGNSINQGDGEARWLSNGFNLSPLPSSSSSLPSWARGESADQIHQAEKRIRHMFMKHNPFSPDYQRTNPPPSIN